MRIVIPAAGLGERLRPHTARRPKCLVEVGGVPIIERLLGQLHELDVELVVCVVGYRFEMVVDLVTGLTRRPPVEFVLNSRYATTNNIVSLQASFPYWNGDTAVVDSDILVAPRLLRALLSAEQDSMVIDGERAPSEIDMAVEIRDGRVWHLDKELPHDRVAGEFFGLSRWTPHGGSRLQDTINTMMAAGETGVWYQFAIRELAKDWPIRPLPAHRDEWIEVDSPGDLTRARVACGAGVPWAAAR